MVASLGIIKHNELNRYKIGNSLICFSSNSLVFLSEVGFACKIERIAPVTLLSWATWANRSWRLFCHEQTERIDRSRSRFCKVQREWIPLSCSLKESSMIHLPFEWIALKNKWFAWKIHIFCMFFIFFTVFPLFMPKSDSLLSLFAQ